MMTPPPLRKCLFVMETLWCSLIVTDWLGDITWLCCLAGTTGEVTERSVVMDPWLTEPWRDWTFVFDGMLLKSSTALCLHYTFIRLRLLVLSQVFVYGFKCFVRLNKGKHLKHSSVSWAEGRFYSTLQIHPEKSASLLQLYDFFS